MSVEGLKKELGARAGELSAPAKGSKGWESREARAKGSLHLKHYDEWFSAAGGRASEVVQAHIDQNGLSCARGEGGPFCAAGASLKHLLYDYLEVDDYTNVKTIRQILVDQGLDPVPLGKPTSHAPTSQPSPP